MPSRRRAARLISFTAALAATGVIVTAQTAGRSAFTRPSMSVRTADPAAARAVIGGVFGWRLAARADELGTPTLFEALSTTDAAGLDYVEAVGGQPIGGGRTGVLDAGMPAPDLDAVLARLDELRLRVAAYRLPAAAGAETLRTQCEFGRRLGASVIVAPATPAARETIDRIAAELNVTIAAGETAPPDRAAVLDLPRALPPDLTTWLLSFSRREPPIRPVGYPLPVGTDAAGEKQRLKPLVITIAANGAQGLRAASAAFETAVRPAIRAYVDGLARLTPISRSSNVPDDERRRVDAAIPRSAEARPRRARRLLVLDLAYNGSFYHGSTALGNLAIELMSKYTRAFTPVFSNDLDNLKYPAIATFDAVFLNQIQGNVFDDDLALEGLTRYVRQGGGVAALHAASWASPNVPAFGQLLGATSGAHKYNGELGALRVDDPASPIVRGFRTTRFEFLDEFYHYIPSGPYSRASLHVLLSLDPSRSDLPANQYSTRPDNDYGMVWIRRYGEGRVFNSGLGHRAEFYESPEMERMLLAGIQFVLGDLAADAGPR